MKTLPNLTEKESKFLTRFLSENGCGASTPGDLLEDNFSCQTVEDMVSWGYSKNEAAGLISSLEQKQVIFIEDEREDFSPSRGFVKAPNLYWVNDWYLEELDENWNFTEEVK